MKLRTFLACAFCVSVLFTQAVTVHAQFQPASFTTSAAIITNPRHPEPYTTFTASFGNYARNLQGAAIAWYEEGDEQTACKNARSCEFTAGGQGSTMNISALFTLPDGTSKSVQYTVVPTRVDVIIEADTTTPLFYRGRALPSSDSTIRAIALPFTSTPSSELVYTWEYDGKTLFGGALRGKDVASFVIPFGGGGEVSVTVADSTGKTFAEKSVKVNSAEPIVRFYEENPLRGLSRVALPSQYQLIGDEVTVRAEPYFMGGDMTTANTEIEWQINRNVVENPSSDPQIITLRSGGGTGAFNVEFFMRNRDKLLQKVRDDFTVSF